MKVIDDLAGNEDECQCGQELEQADEAEVPGAVRQVVHLPAEGDEQHLVRGGAREPREPQPHEGVMLEKRRRRPLERRAVGQRLDGLGAVVEVTLRRQRDPAVWQRGRAVSRRHAASVSK